MSIGGNGLILLRIGIIVRALVNVALNLWFHTPWTYLVTSGRNYVLKTKEKIKREN